MKPNSYPAIRPGSLALIGAVILSANALHAQPTYDYTYSTPDVVAAPGATISVPILLDASNGPPVDGLSYSFCFDESVVLLTDILLGSDTIGYSPVPALGPEYLFFNQGPGFLRFAVLLDVAGPYVFPSIADLEITVAVFEAVGVTGDVSPLAFCEAGIPPLELVIVPDGTGQSITPSLDDGSVTITENVGSYSLTLPASASMGSPFAATIAIDATMPLDGVRLGLSHDPAQALPTDVTPSAALAAMNGGAGPDQLLVELFPGIGPGLTIDCVFDGAGVEMLPAGASDLFTVTYDALYLPQTCATAAFAFTDALGVPLEVVTAGGTIPVIGTGATFSIAPGSLPAPSGGVAMQVEDAFVSPGGIAEVPVTLDSDVVVQGFSFGVEHSDPTVSLLTIVPGNLVSTLGCGAGPAFFDAYVPSPTTHGFVVAVCDFDPSAGGNLIPVGSGIEIARLVYQTASGSLPMDIELVGGLGNPPVALEVTSNFAMISPTVASGTLASGVPFWRGECNLDGAIDLADAITILSFLFPNEPVAPPLCRDGCDANDDGALNIGDAITILGALFGSSTIAGTPGCALDETPNDPLGCSASGSCD